MLKISMKYLRVIVVKDCLTGSGGRDSHFERGARKQSCYGGGY